MSWTSAPPERTIVLMSAAARHRPAATPEELADLWIARAEARDLEGLVALYAPDAVVQFGPGEASTGRDAIREAHRPIVEAPAGTPFALGTRLPTLTCGDIALCGSTADGRGRTQVARRQPDGTWLRILDRPNP